MTVCWLGVAKLFISTLSSFLGAVSPINQPTNRYQNVYSAKGMATASDQYGQFLMQYGATSSSSSLNGESAEGFATRARLARRRQSQKEKRDRKEASSHHHRRTTTTTTTTKGTTPVAIVSTSIPQSSNVTRRLRNSNKNAGKPQPKVPAMPAPMVREREGVMATAMMDKCGQRWLLFSMQHFAMIFLLSHVQHKSLPIIIVTTKRSPITTTNNRSPLPLTKLSPH
jgi:hypothetical protein